MTPQDKKHMMNNHIHQQKAISQDTGLHKNAIILGSDILISNLVPVFVIDLGVL